MTEQTKQLQTERDGWKEAYQECRDRLWELQTKLKNVKDLDTLYWQDVISGQTCLPFGDWLTKRFSD